MNKKMVILAIAVLSPLAYIDNDYLVGETIQHSPVTIKPAYDQAQTVDIQIDEPGMPYSIDLSVGFANTKERAEVRLTASSGQEGLHKVEIEKRNGVRRYFFTPDETGIYQLRISLVSVAPIPRSSMVSVVKNDRRIPSRFIGYLAI